MVMAKETAKAKEKEKDNYGSTALHFYKKSSKPITCCFFIVKTAQRSKYHCSPLFMAVSAFLLRRVNSNVEREVCPQMSSAADSASGDFDDNTTTLQQN